MAAPASYGIHSSCWSFLGGGQWDSSCLCQFFCQQTRAAQPDMGVEDREVEAVAGPTLSQARSSIPFSQLHPFLPPITESCSISNVLRGSLKSQDRCRNNNEKVHATFFYLLHICPPFQLGSPILWCLGPVGATVTKGLLLYSMGAAAAIVQTWGTLCGLWIWHWRSPSVPPFLHLPSSAQKECNAGSHETYHQPAWRVLLWALGRCQW